MPVQHPDFMVAVDAYIEDHWSKFSPLDVSKTVWAYAKLRVFDEFVEKVPDRIIDEVFPHVKSANDSNADVDNIDAPKARANTNPFRQDSRRFPAYAAVDLLWGLATLGVEHEQFAYEVANVCLSGKYDMKELANLSWSLDKMLSVSSSQPEKEQGHGEQKKDLTEKWKVVWNQIDKLVIDRYPDYTSAQILAVCLRRSLDCPENQVIIRCLSARSLINHSAPRIN